MSKQDIKEWITNIDQMLTSRGCKKKFVKSLHVGSGDEYYHKKTNIRICRIVVNENDCFVVLHGNHFATPYCVVDELPENMLYPLKNQRGCRPCIDPKTCTMAGNGERYYQFTLHGKDFLCCGGGFRYNLNEDTDLALLKKWIESELRWFENDVNTYPEKKIILDEIESSYAKRWAKNRIKPQGIGNEPSVFDLPNKEQSRIKPSIEEACVYFLKDAIVYANITRLIAYLRNLGLEIKWKARNKYVVRHNKVELLYFRFEGLNDFNVIICAFYYWEKRDIFQGFIDSLPADKKQKFIQTNAFHCHECNEICSHRVPYEYVLCSTKTYVSENPTHDKLDEIEWFINIGMAYIDFKIVNDFSPFSTSPSKER